MQLRASQTTIFAAAAIAGLTFVTLAIGSGEMPAPPNLLPPMAPVSPTVAAPVHPASHLVRYQSLVPVQGLKAGESTKPGQSDKAPPPKEIESGPELSLGDCIAIAIERSPNLKAVKASTAATEAGYRRS